MDIIITDGTNAKAQRVTRIKIEISDHDLATIDGNPDELLKVIKRSREPAKNRLVALAALAGKIKA